MQSDLENQYDDELMDSLLHEQARVDRERLIREIDHAIMKDAVDYAVHSPTINWKHMLISGSIAAALVLGFGYFLSMILMPGMHGNGQVAAAGSGNDSVSGNAKEMTIEFTTEQIPKSAKTVRSSLPSGAPVTAPRMVFSSPLTGMGDEFEFYANLGIDEPKLKPDSEPKLLVGDEGSFKLVDQEWRSPYDKPLSTFSADVDNASYANIRRLIQEGAVIPQDIVRIEECINAFEYNYEGPKRDKAFAIHTDLITCPWDGSKLLVKVGIKGREISSANQAASSPATIAKDLKVLMEFNPKLVGSYRLIGYASPVIMGEAPKENVDATDTGDIKAGYTLTAFYEIVPARKQVKLARVDPLKYQRVGSAPAAVGAKDEWLTLKLYHKQAQGNALTTLEKVHKGAPTPWLYANADTRFATSVVLFGMKLRGMDDVEGITWQQVAQVADPVMFQKDQKDRVEFIELINALESGNP